MSQFNLFFVNYNPYSGASIQLPKGQDVINDDIKRQV